jgi:hypothetical protein
MLLRILADNPGPTFTRNVDKKFVEATKELLRGGRDPSVRQILMETLDTFETQKMYDEGLLNIIEMWKKEKEKAYKAYGVSCAHLELTPLTVNAMLTNIYTGTPSTYCCSTSLKRECTLSRSPFAELLRAQPFQQAAAGPRRAR